MHDLTAIAAVLSVILAAAFLTRLLPRLVLPNAISSDSYFHLAMSRVIRDNGHQIPETVPRVLVCGRCSYPFLYHWILSFVPERHLALAERLSSPVIETVYTAAAFGFALAIDRTAGLTASPEATALWVAALFVLSPALIGVAGGPRAFNGTPRTLGQCLFLIFAGSAVMFDLTGSWPWGMVAVLVAAALSVTSKFGNQALVFIAAGLLPFGYFGPAAIVVAGYVVAAIATRGRAVRVLRGQIAHSIFYARHLQQRFLHRGRVRAADFLARAAGAARNVLRAPIAAIRWIFVEPFFYQKIIVGAPQLVIIALAFAGAFGSEARAALSMPALSLCIAFVGASVAASLLVALKPLAFLGEAERYAEHTVMFQILAFVVIADGADFSWAKPALLAYSALAYGVSVKTFVERNGDTSDLARSMAQLVAPIDRSEVRIFWLGHVFWPLWFSTRKASVLVHGANFDESQMDKESWFEVFGNLPYPGVPVQQVIDRYKLDYVVATHESVAYYEKLLDDCAFSEGRLREAGRAGDLILYASRRSLAAAAA